LYGPSGAGRDSPAASSKRRSPAREAIGPAFVVLFCWADRAGRYERLGFREVVSPVRVQQPEGFEPAAQLMMWRTLEPGATWPAGEVTLFGLPF
jgi:hypothetical protein